MKRKLSFDISDNGGFTLSELMMSIVILSMVMAGAYTAFISSQRIWHSTDIATEVSEDVSFTLDKMVYGVGDNLGLRAAEKSEVSIAASGGNWTLAYGIPSGPTNYFTYDSSLDHIVFTNTATVSNAVTIGDSLTSASVSTNASGITITLTAAKSRGRFSSTNTMSTYVDFRN